MVFKGSPLRSFKYPGPLSLEVRSYSIRWNPQLHLRPVTPPTVMTRSSTGDSLELAKSTSPALATPKPSVKRELLFEGVDTPKKAKAPVPSRKVVYAVVKTEKLTTTAAKSMVTATVPPAQPPAPVMSKLPPPVMSKPPSPPVMSKPPSPPVVSKPPSPVVMSKPPSPVVMSKPPSPVIAKPPPPVMSKPPSPVVKASPSTLQQQAAMLRKAPPTPKQTRSSSSSPEMAERRILNKATDMTDEDRELLELENAILDELAKKSDDELDAMMHAIMAHPLFPRFVKDKKEEYGCEEFEFDDFEQIATWELWVQRATDAPIEKTASAAALPSPDSKASPPAPTPKTTHVPKVALPKPVAVAKAAEPAPAKKQILGGEAFSIGVKEGSGVA